MLLFVGRGRGRCFDCVRLSAQHIVPWGGDILFFFFFLLFLVRGRERKRSSKELCVNIEECFCTEGLPFLSLHFHKPCGIHKRKKWESMARGRMMRARDVARDNMVTSVLQVRKQVSAVRKRPRPVTFEESGNVGGRVKKLRVGGEMQERMRSLGVVEMEMMGRLLMEEGPIVKGEGGLGRDVRQVLVDWMMEVGGEYEVAASTIAVAVAYLDRVMRMMEVGKDDLQLVAVVCVLLACKMEESEAPSINDVVFICDGLYGQRKILEMEQQVVRRLNYCMLIRTPLHVLKGLARAMGICESVVEFVGRCALMEERVAQFGVGVVTVACLVVGGRVCGKVWTADGVVGEVVQLMWKSWERMWALHHRLDVSRWLVIKWPEMAERVEKAAKELKAMPGK